jgi:hypothetical protein
VAPIHAILLVVNLVAQPVGMKPPRGSVSRFAKRYESEKRSFIRQTTIRGF